MTNFTLLLKSKKNYIIFIGIILAFLLLRLVLLHNPSTELTYTVKKENLVDTVQASGTYTTASQTEVTSPSTGIIDKLFVTNGMQVKKGESLLHIESSATEDQQKVAYAAYLSANSTLQADTANLYSLQSTMYSDWKKYTDLSTNSTYQNSDGSPNDTNRVLPEFTTAQDNWLYAEQAYKNQQAVIAKDQASLASSKRAYDETQSVTISAPIGGMVTNLLSKIGDQATANTSSVTIAGNSSGQANITSSAPSSILVISNLSNPYITAEISEDYATSIAQGQKASIVFDALRKKTFSGKVIGIDSVATTTDGVVTYTARISIDNLSSNIKPGMTALITIETLRKNNVIDIPNSAIITKGNISYVELANNHTLIPIEIGTQGVAKTEITHGLYEGTVIVADTHSS